MYHPAGNTFSYADAHVTLQGWYDIRRESKWLAAIFITCACILIICWAIVFYSQVRVLIDIAYAREC